MTQGRPGGWQPAMPPDGPTSPTTPVRPHAGYHPPPASSSFDAVGMQSVLTRARDQSRFVAPVPEEETKRRPIPVRGLAWTVVLVLILGVSIGVIYVNYFRPVVHDPATVVQPAPGPTDQAPVVTTQTPQEIVAEYFTAISTGQVARALSMGPTGEGSSALLNDEVHARARELLPITDVEILSDEPTATEIPVRYRIGGVPYETTVRLQLLDSGEYQLARTTATAEFSVPGGQNLPLLVNGQPVDSDQAYELLPGRYEVTTGLPFIDYTTTSALEVPGLGRETPYSVNVTPELTDAGETALIDAARRSLNDCISRHEIAPKGCPNRAGTQARGGVIDSSARWTLTNNPWADAAPRLTAEDQSVAIVRVSIATTLSFDYAAGGSSQGRRPITTRSQASAPMLGDDPSAIEVTWSVG